MSIILGILVAVAFVAIVVLFIRAQRTPKSPPFNPGGGTDGGGGTDDGDGTVAPITEKKGFSFMSGDEVVSLNTVNKQRVVASTTKRQKTNPVSTKKH